MDLHQGVSDMAELTFRKEFTVHTYEVDSQGRARLISLRNRAHPDQDPPGQGVRP